MPRCKFPLWSFQKNCFFIALWCVQQRLKWVKLMQKIQAYYVAINSSSSICLQIEFSKQFLILLNDMVPECRDHFGWQEQEECQDWTKEHLDKVSNWVMINIFRGAGRCTHCCCWRKSFYYCICQICNEGRGNTKGRDTCPILDARFKSQFLVLHVNFFKGLNMLTHKAAIQEDKINFTEILTTFNSTVYYCRRFKSTSVEDQ